MKPPIIKVTLSFQNGIGDAHYRIDTLVGAVNIPWQSKPKAVTWRIGDHLTEEQAMDLANTRGYEVKAVARKES